VPRIGIFGGSFDPVHNAHVALARLALTELQLDELRWVPAGQPWQKARGLTAAGHREAMLRLAIAGEPRFTLSRLEVERGGESYTLDTVRQMQAELPGAQWFLVIGQDQYASFHSWHGWQELLTRVTLAVANRSHSGRPGAAPVADAQVRQVAHQSVALPMMDVSSTDIRARIARGQGIDDLVPPAVARYIDQHDLYQGQPGS
jgi:nicotinate-nucleotide adenylyltransferase